MYHVCCCAQYFVAFALSLAFFCAFVTSLCAHSILMIFSYPAGVHVSFLAVVGRAQHFVALAL